MLIQVGPPCPAGVGSTTANVTLSSVQLYSNSARAWTPCVCFQYFKIFAGVCGPVACITLHRCVRLATVVRATGVGGGGGLFVALGASSNTLAVVGMIAMNNLAGGGCTMAHCPEYFGQGGGIEIVNDLCRGAFPWSRSSGAVDILLDSVLVSSNVAGKGADSPSCGHAKSFVAV